MKKFVFLLSVIIASASASAQKITKENLPPSVAAAFKAKFSIAEKTTWEMDYDKYEAEFTVGKGEFSATFDKEGKWLETETYLKPSDLPKAIKEKLSQKYGELSGYKIEEAVKAETEKETTYEVDIKRGEIFYELTFDEKGQLLREEKKSETKKD